VAVRFPGEIVIGGDQLATIHGAVLGKPGTVEAAVDQLEVLSGHTHTLVTAMTVIGPDGTEYSHLDLSYLTMRALARIFHEYLIRKHINNLLYNQSVFLLETLFLRKASP
jgi:septum formation protein